MEPHWIIGICVGIIGSLLGVVWWTHTASDNEFRAEILRQVEAVVKDLADLQKEVLKDYARAGYVEEIDRSHIKRWHDFRNQELRAINDKITGIQVMLANRRK